VRKKLLALLVALNLALIAAPLLTAIPFVTQTPALLAIAYWTRTAAPIITTLSVLLAASLLAHGMWGSRAQRARLPIARRLPTCPTTKTTWYQAFALIVIAACVVLARANNLEWIFAAAGAPQTADVAGFHEIRDNDMVIGVTIGGASRAYPVRYLAHHHMLNDTLGGAALLPTY
jgi:lysylphosphatidylglycerol synthetase-like protein (DUF2156 family)